MLCRVDLTELVGVKHRFYSKCANSSHASSLYCALLMAHSFCICNAVLQVQRVLHFSASFKQH